MVLKNNEKNALSKLESRNNQKMKYGKIQRGWQFEKVYKEGSKFYDDLFVLYALPNNINEARIGLTVTKKIGNSVQRNRIKRLIREAFRLSNRILPGNDIVVVARKPSVDLKYSQAKNSLDHLLRRAKLLES
jgi:ribonuclease P protein component